MFSIELCNSLHCMWVDESVTEASAVIICMSAHSQIEIIFTELNYGEIRFCGSCSTLWCVCVCVCVQSSGKLEMERGMVKPMIRGEQQDSRSDTHSSPLSPLFLPSSSIFIVSLVLWLVLLSLLSAFGVAFPSHVVILSLQVSGHFSRQIRVDSASWHRVQRQL